MQPTDFSPRIDPAGDTPPFEQLKVAVVAAVESGELPVGARLPAVRSLAADVGLAPNTVAKAYRELEDEGVLEGRGRSGTFVRATGAGSDPLTRAAYAYAVEARRLGAEPDDALAAVARAVRAVER